MTNRGGEAERVVQDICNLRFFADFTYHSPKYRKSGGQQKEAADVLLVFGETLIAIQIKTKKVKIENGGISEIEHRRITSAMEDGIRQFRSLAEALGRPDFDILVNSRGVAIELNKNSIKELILILIVDAFVEDGSCENYFVPAKTCIPEESPVVPLHIFSLFQFNSLALLADTLPDFLNFLRVSWLLHSRSLLPHSADPLDEWAVMQFERSRLGDAVDSGALLDVSGMYMGSVSKVIELEEKEKISYLIDNLIDDLANGVGKEWGIDPGLEGITHLLEIPNSQRANNALIPFLARLRRAYRVEIAKCYLEKIARCKNSTKDSSFTGIIFSEFDEGYFIFATTLDFEAAQLSMLSAGWEFCRKQKLKKAICIFGCNVADFTQPLGILMIDPSNDWNAEILKGFDAGLFDEPEYRNL